MATNTLLTNDIILKEGMMHLYNELVVSKLCNRQFEGEFGGGINGGVKAGSTIRIARPIRGQVRTGATMAPQDITEGREAPDRRHADRRGSGVHVRRPDALG